MIPADYRLAIQVVLGAVAAAAKVIIDRGIIKIEPFKQPPEAVTEGKHYFKGDYVAESIMMAGQAALDTIDAMATQISGPE